MEKPELNDDLLELLKAFGNNHDPMVLEVSARRLTKEGVEEYHKICSKCFAFIDKTWDHEEWCELYEPEKLSEWIKKGKNEK